MIPSTPIFVVGLSFCLALFASGKRIVESPIKHNSPEEIRAKVVELFIAGQVQDLLTYLMDIESKRGHLIIDNFTPSLYTYRGVALAGHSVRNPEAAIEAFKNATKYNPDDTRSYINIGEVCIQTFRFKEAIAALLTAESLGDEGSIPRLLKAMGWIGSWQNFERITSKIEKGANLCYEVHHDQLLYSQHCKVDSTQGFEYADLSGAVHRMMHSSSPNCRISPLKIDTAQLPHTWKENARNLPVKRRLKVGVLSSDFGIHPIATLVRGLFQYVDKKDVELFAFTLDPKMSYWGSNVSNTVEHFVNLEDLNTFDAAKIILSRNIEILIDLNGHTLNTGLPILSHMPAPIQMSFLGLPTTTGAAFIDYYIGDAVALPAEHADHFTEKLILGPSCYILNDYAQMAGDVIYLTGPARASRSSLNADEDLDDATVLFATFSNSQKIDPFVFQSWMNILQRTPGAKLLFLDYEGMAEAVVNFRMYTQHFGLSRSRVVKSDVLPWIDHLNSKTSIDMVLDTGSKNGHTSGLDGIWAGVPTMTLGGGAMMPSRAGESMAAAMRSEFGLLFSLKEYEDWAAWYAAEKREPLAGAGGRPVAGGGMMAGLNRGMQARQFKTAVKHKSPWRLRLLRDFVEQQRLTTPLFDTPLFTHNFVRFMQATWEAAHVSGALGHVSGVNSDFDSDFYEEEDGEEGYGYGAEFGRKRKFYHIFSVGKSSSANSKSSRGAFDESAPLLYADEKGRKEVAMTSAAVASAILDNTEQQPGAHLAHLQWGHRSPHRIQVRQATDGNPPAWLPGRKDRERFIKRFGYDPSRTRVHELEKALSMSTSASASASGRPLSSSSSPSSTLSPHSRISGDSNSTNTRRAEASKRIASGSNNASASAKSPVSESLKGSKTPDKTSSSGAGDKKTTAVASEHQAGAAHTSIRSASRPTHSRRQATMKRGNSEGEEKDGDDEEEEEETEEELQHRISQDSAAFSDNRYTQDGKDKKGRNVGKGKTGAKGEPPAELLAATAPSKQQKASKAASSASSSSSSSSSSGSSSSSSSSSNSRSSSKKPSQRSQGGAAGHRRGSEPHHMQLCKKMVNPPLDPKIFDIKHIMLNIGGLEPAPDWLNVNSDPDSFREAIPNVKVDVVRQMHDLEGFPNRSVAAIYSSHILEHNSYGDGMLDRVLQEWARVLRPGGMMLVSVPDLRKLARWYLDDSLTLAERMRITAMMYGGQNNAYDYHYVGFDELILGSLLKSSGFCDVERVGSFNIFGDTSEAAFRGKRISLNMVARRCVDDKKSFDGFNIEHSASPYDEDE